ncbi:MAG: ATP-binding protein [Desulfuromonadaceae bacterium]|nr:ATP-binding protein [Desulfuromonadaceae bacterium]
MFKVSSLDDFNLLRESSSIEFKLAGGRDGKGELPQDFWPTYSAMANTDGGVVVLGVRERKDETPIHDALREALANVLVHADYSERASVLVIKQADKFRFRNPGLMRVPVSIAIQGGEPDCRNRMLHKMFRLVGVGEQAGSGIPIILQGWKSQHWSPPNLYELREPYDQTVLELRMVDLFPSDVMDALHAHFGAKFEALDSDMRLILALASIEETVSHARLITALSAHPVEITRMLQQLCQAEMLVTEGSGKGTVYFLPWQKLPTAEQVFGPYQRSSSIDSVSSSVGMAASSVDSANSSIGLNNQRDESGRLITEHLCLPVIDDLVVLSPELKNNLEQLAKEPREKKRVSPEIMDEALLALCEGHYLSLHVLAELVQRNSDFLRTNYLSALIKDKKISMAFPTTPTHERQAYCLAESLQRLGQNDE